MPLRPGETGELLSETPEWADVEPWVCPEDGHAVVDIQYTEEYVDTMGLLYAVIKSGEKSKRVLKLTEKCIMLCPSHYTAWDWRYQVRFILLLLVQSPCSENAISEQPLQLATQAPEKQHLACSAWWRREQIWTRSGRFAWQLQRAVGRTISSGTIGACWRCRWAGKMRCENWSSHLRFWTLMRRIITSGHTDRCRHCTMPTPPFCFLLCSLLALHDHVFETQHKGTQAATILLVMRYLVHEVVVHWHTSLHSSFISQDCVVNKVETMVYLYTILPAVHAGNRSALWDVGGRVGEHVEDD